MNSATNIFIQTMDKHSFGNIDNFFTSQDFSAENFKVASFTFLKVSNFFMVLCFISFLAGFFFIAFLSNIDSTVKFISQVLYLFFSFSIFLLITFFKLNSRFKLLKEICEERGLFSSLKTIFLYTPDNKNEIFKNLVFSKKIYGEERFEQISQDCQLSSVSTKDLYFIYNCLKYESLFKTIYQIKTFISRKLGLTL